MNSKTSSPTAQPSSPVKMIGVAQRVRALSRASLRADLIAGVTTAAVTIPDAMATGILAGASPVTGLYSLMVGMPVAALLASSQFMYVANTGAQAIAVNGVLQDFGPAQVWSALAVLVVLVGVIELALGLLKAGGLVRYVSNAVLMGFMTGIAINIILGQLGDFTDFQSSAPHRLLKTVDLLTHLSQIDWPATIVASVTLIALLIFQRVKRVSQFAMILALALGSLLPLVFHWDQVEVLSDIAAMPHGFPVPIDLDLALVPMLLPGALAVAIIGLVQGSAVSRSVPNRDGNYPNVSRDFVAQGAGNLASGLFGGLPLGGSMGQTTVNVKAGAQTRLALLFSAAIIIVVVLAFGNIVGYLPLPAIAALLIVAGYEAINIPGILDAWHAGRAPRGIMLFTLVMTLLLPVQWAVILGVVLAMGQFIYQSSIAIQIKELKLLADGSWLEGTVPQRLTANSIVVLQPYGSLYFAGASTLESKLPDPNEATGATVIIRLRGLDQVGSTLVSVLERYAKKVQRAGAQLMLTELDEHVYEQLNLTDTIALIGPERAYRAEVDFLAATRAAVEEANRL